MDPVTSPAQNQTIGDICDSIIREDGKKPYDIWLSDDPYDNRLTMTIDVRGDHPTLGILTKTCTERNALQLIDIAKSAPAARLHNWRSTLRFAYILSANGKIINTDHDLTEAIAAARKNKALKIQVTFGTEKKYGVHPGDGNLHLYFDQMNAFARHVHASDREYREQLKQQQAYTEKAPDTQDAIPQSTIRSTSNTEPPPPAKPPDPTPNVDDPDLGRSFTKKQLLKRDDWQTWRESQWKQLDQYHNQGMFSEPQPLPEGIVASYMLWTYIYKMCGTKKARMVCDGARTDPPPRLVTHTPTR